jgi:tRNA pseudouridine32 synthase/23S rRNA pseudouridine746 synthase
MVLGLNADTHRALRKQFEARTVEKTYVAIVVGSVVDDDGVIELPFRLDVEHRPHQIYDPVHGKMGVTHFQVLERLDGRTRVRFTPHTGRTHQLRVHAAHALGLACPIAGDRLYGDPQTAPRLLLHAETLRFTHPKTGAALDLCSAVPF